MEFEGPSPDDKVLPLEQTAARSAENPAQQQATISQAGSLDAIKQMEKGQPFSQKGNEPKPSKDELSDYILQGIIDNLMTGNIGDLLAASSTHNEQPARLGRTANKPVAEGANGGGSGGNTPPEQSHKGVRIGRTSDSIPEQEHRREKKPIPNGGGGGGGSDYLPEKLRTRVIGGGAGHSMPEQEHRPEKKPIPNGGGGGGGGDYPPEKLRTRVIGGGAGHSMPEQEHRPEKKPIPNSGGGGGGGDDYPSEKQHRW